MKGIAAFEIADWLLDSGLGGVTLSKSLAERFPRATRSDMCLGLAIFATDMHAELLLAKVEAQALRVELKALREALAPLPAVAA